MNKIKLIQRVRWLVSNLNPDLDLTNLRIEFSDKDNDCSEFIQGSGTSSESHSFLKIAPRSYVNGPIERIYACVIASLCKELHPRMLTRRIIAYDDALSSAESRAGNCADLMRLRQEIRLDHEIRLRVLRDLTDLYLVADSNAVELMNKYNLDARGYLKYLRSERWLNDTYILHPLRRKAHRMSMKVRIASAYDCLTGVKDPLLYSKIFREEFDKLVDSAPL